MYRREYIQREIDMTLPYSLHKDALKAEINDMIKANNEECERTKDSDEALLVEYRAALRTKAKGTPAEQQKARATLKRLTEDAYELAKRRAEWRANPIKAVE